MKGVLSILSFANNWSLVRRIAFVIALGWLVFVFITIISINIYLNDQLVDIHFESENKHLLALVNRVEDSFEVRKEAISKMASFLTNNEQQIIDDENLLNILRVAQLSAYFEDLVLLDPNATTLIQYPYLSERVNVNYADRIFIQKLIETQQLTISAPILGRVTGLPSIFFAQPIIDDANNLLGILTARIALEKDAIFNQISNEFVRYDGELMIADLQNNILIAATDENKLMLPISKDDVLSQIIDNDSSGKVQDSSGRYWLYSSTPFEDFDWVMINLTPKNEITASVKKYTAQYLLIILPLIIASGVIFTVWIYKIFIPMRKALTELETNLIDQTGFSVIQVSRMDEVGKLLTAINELQLMKSAQEQIKDDLLSIVTHEIRTPITAIRAAIRLLSISDSEMRNDDFNRLIEISNRNTDKLLLLINDLLDLSSLAKGKLSLSFAVVSLCEVVSESVDDMLSIAASSNINLQFICANSGVFVYLDKFRFQQVMFNLISNSIKFSEVNTDVKVEVYSDKEFGYVSISDNGIGIPVEYHKRIFERFTQVDSSDTRNHRGTGLGLAIANELIKEMDGDISMQSEVGVGTTFYIKLPLFT